jgi:sugar lactone lactonase YvrE
MSSANPLPDLLESADIERLATGFIFTEGPLWHPEGFWYFVDIRQNKLFRMVPGQTPEVVRTTRSGNGTTFDLEGRLVVCEGDDRCLMRLEHRLPRRSPTRSCLNAFERFPWIHAPQVVRGADTI